MGRGKAGWATGRVRRGLPDYLLIALNSFWILLLEIHFPTRSGSQAVEGIMGLIVGHESYELLDEPRALMCLATPLLAKQGRDAFSVDFRP